MWVPTLRSSRLSFFQAVLEGRKELIETKEVTQMNIDQLWPDWAVKHVWPQVKAAKKIHAYLPTEEMDNGAYPDRNFFWGILFTRLPNVDLRRHH